MRIIAGEFRGRVVDAPEGRSTRPTTDRVRESMFSSIISRQGDLDGLYVLDAFAGSGALGIEALSRGAQHCTYFEYDAKAKKVLDKNLKSLKLGADRIAVKNTDIFSASERPLCPAKPYSLVLLDPPYATEATKVIELITRLDLHGDLESGATIVYEHALESHSEVEEALTQLEGFEQDGWKKYGKIEICYLAYSGK